MLPETIICIMVSDVTRRAHVIDKNGNTLANITLLVIYWPGGGISATFVDINWVVEYFLVKGTRFPCFYNHPGVIF